MQCWSYLTELCANAGHCHPCASESRESGLIWVEKALEHCKDSVLNFKRCFPCLHRLSRVQQLKLIFFPPSAAHLWCSYVDILIRLQMCTHSTFILVKAINSPHTAVYIGNVKWGFLLHVEWYIYVSWDPRMDAGRDKKMAELGLISWREPAIFWRSMERKKTQPSPSHTAFA